MFCLLGKHSIKLLEIVGYFLFNQLYLSYRLLGLRLYFSLALYNRSTQNTWLLIKSWIKFKVCWQNVHERISSFLKSLLDVIYNNLFKWIFCAEFSKYVWPISAQCLHFIQLLQYQSVRIRSRNGRFLISNFYSVTHQAVIDVVPLWKPWCLN